MRRRRALLVCALVLAAVGAGCGGGSSDTAGGTTTGTTTSTAPATTAAAAEPVPADEWAGDVCGALTDWQGELTTNLPTIDDPSDAEATKETVVDYLDRVTTATSNLVGEVEAAGTPDVDEGAAIAADFRSAIASVEQSFAEAKAEVEGLSTDDPSGFAAGLERVGTTLQSAGTEAVRVFADVGTRHPALNDAMAGAQACSSLR